MVIAGIKSARRLSRAGTSSSHFQHQSTQRVIDIDHKLYRRSGLTAYCSWCSPLSFRCTSITDGQVSVVKKTPAPPKPTPAENPLCTIQ
jgi:hypothetical protein